MNHLIDMEEVAQRVQKVFEGINLNHVTYLETIVMLLDELDAKEAYISDIYKEIETIKSGKPTWMNKNE